MLDVINDENMNLIQQIHTNDDILRRFDSESNLSQNQENVYYELFFTSITLIILAYAIIGQIIMDINKL